MHKRSDSGCDFVSGEPSAHIEIQQKTNYISYLRHPQGFCLSVLELPRACVRRNVELETGFAASLSGCMISPHHLYLYVYNMYIYIYVIIYI